MRRRNAKKGTVVDGVQGPVDGYVRRIGHTFADRKGQIGECVHSRPDLIPGLLPSHKELIPSSPEAIGNAIRHENPLTQFRRNGRHVESERNAPSNCSGECQNVPPFRGKRDTTGPRRRMDDTNITPLITKWTPFGLEADQRGYLPWKAN